METFTARFKALPGKEAEAGECLAAMVSAVAENEPGAIAYVCHTVPANPGEFFFYEVYADEAAKAAHMETPHFKKLFALIGEVFDADFGAQVEDLERLAGVVRT